MAHVKWVDMQVQEANKLCHIGPDALNAMAISSKAGPVQGDIRIWLVMHHLAPSRAIWCPAGEDWSFSAQRVQETTSGRIETCMKQLIS